MPPPAARPSGTRARDPRLTRARALSSRAVRERRGRFLVEGPQAVREALAGPGRVTEVLATADADARHPELRRAAERAGVEWVEVAAAELATVTETVSGQGIVAVARLLTADAGAVFGAGPQLVAGLCDVRDPGNAGTVVRTADAAGADAVALLGDAVDPHNGKCVRASVGSVFHLPLLRGLTVAAGVAAARAAGLQVFAADGAGDVELTSAAAAALLAAPTLWLFGNEAHGLADAELALADHVVRIPIHGRAESLNLATAAALCLYASATAQHR